MRHARVHPRVFVGWWSLVPALGGVFLWCVVGVLNMESALHIDYSLGSSSGWHSWFDRGDPGEVIRRWGVPIYDQWTGLGYRLPTQGLLTDTPLSYLAMVLPVNSVVMVAWLASLWFMFALVHRWVVAWASAHRVMWCVLVDASLLGLMSFYTLWHGWQGYAIQVAGAVVCVVSVTSREVVEDPKRAELFPLTANLSLGTLMLMIPHVGYGMTYAPTIAVLFAFVVFSQRGVLVRRIVREPEVLVGPLLAVVALLPGILDIVREQRLQAAFPAYQPEMGVLHYTLFSGQFLGWLLGVLPLFHTLVFPLLALFDPGAYGGVLDKEIFRRPWTAVGWPHKGVQFHGGVLTLILAGWSVARPKLSKGSCLERAVAVLAVTSMTIALLNTNNVPGHWLSLEWIPSGLLSNGRWQHSDVSLLLTLVLLVWRANDLVARVSNSTGSPPPSFLPRLNSALHNLTKLSVVFGLLCLVCVLPYRFIEPLRLNSGQTRFSPLHFNGEIRSDNERWRSVLDDHKLKLSISDGPKRMLIDGGLIEGEGQREWWGLRTHSQLRDIQVSSLLSWPRLRRGDTLTPGAKIQHVVRDFSCDNNLPDRLDILAVTWSLVQDPCSSTFLPRATRVTVPMPPPWSSVVSQRQPESIMDEMTATTSTGHYSAVKTETFHQWWTPIRTSLIEPCPFLTNDCVTKVGLIRGKKVDSPPLTVCRRDCVAVYRLSQPPLQHSRLLIPLNYDPSLRVMQNGLDLHTTEYAGLLTIDSQQLQPGIITITIHPDLIMRLRTVAPIAVTILILLAAQKRRFSRLKESEDLTS